MVCHLLRRIGLATSLGSCWANHNNLFSMRRVLYNDWQRSISVPDLKKSRHMFQIGCCFQKDVLVFCLAVRWESRVFPAWIWTKHCSNLHVMLSSFHLSVVFPLVSWIKSEQRSLKLICTCKNVSAHQRLNRHQMIAGFSDFWNTF